MHKAQSSSSFLPKAKPDKVHRLYFKNSLTVLSPDSLPAEMKAHAHIIRLRQSKFPLSPARSRRSFFTSKESLRPLSETAFPGIIEPYASIHYQSVSGFEALLHFFMLFTQSAVIIPALFHKEKSMLESCDFIVVGAGASGLTAAAEAARAGKSVLVADRCSLPAQKVFISGGGKCNFSNKNVSSTRYLSANPHFCKSALSRFSWQDFTAKLDSAGIPWEEREDGKLFAFSGSSVRRMLLQAAQEAGCIFSFGISSFSLEKKDGGFLAFIDGKAVFAKAVLIASGGLSYPSAGATDIGYRLAEQFGLNIIPTAPALVPLHFDMDNTPDMTGLSGISLPVEIRTGKKIFSGSLLFTPLAFSGPAILQASLYKTKDAPVRINFLPGVNILEWLKSRRNAKDKRQAASVLCEKMPQRLAQKFAALLPGEKSSLPVTELPDKLFSLLADKIGSYTFIPPETSGWKKAEVTKGGVDTAELSSATMECRKLPGLYFAGEIIDVTGEIGGFNLHWAWASGTAAGRAAAQAV